MIDRILKNWKTTVLGLAILITCFILVFMEKSTLTEVSVFICGGFFVLFSKDSMLRKKACSCAKSTNAGSNGFIRRFGIRKIFCICMFIRRI